MATLSANEPRRFVVGERNHLEVVASDTIFEGAAVGILKSSGYARPLTAGDEFVGFAVEKVDNESGSAGDRHVEVYKEGGVDLDVSGAVITDINQPVYASDDDTFTLDPVGNTFIGFVRRFNASGEAHVEFNAGVYQDPYGDGPKETISDNKTLDAQDTGKTFFVDTDAKTVTLPATATALDCTIVNIGAYGAVAVNVSPQSADKIMGPDIAGTDDKDLINTKATAQRGDRVSLYSGHTDGYVVRELVGTWAEEA